MGNAEAIPERKPFGWLCTNTNMVDNRNEFDLQSSNPGEILKYNKNSINYKTQQIYSDGK